VEAAGLGFTLYVNCLPMKGPDADRRPTLLGELLAPIQRQVNEELGQNYRLVPYGDGLKALVYALEEYLKTGQLLGAIVLNTHEVDGSQCAMVLAQYASAVVHGC